ncbi:hypothetical protein N7497_008675 [Penicillium chrysogenum]|uniref:Uncharacterized protein n=1 Tax=Penicillium chrysogenum TaxID=5076 RepID=A0ABQ8WLP3_PENCH|nr:hypothetical protein N7505_006313 [Penicillium chrysogenum]KAJ6146693.1 hypothetical protein N7497_008675 [Penicillium chrysogenum]
MTWVKPFDEPEVYRQLLFASEGAAVKLEQAAYLTMNDNVVTIPRPDSEVDNERASSPEMRSQ